MNRMFQIAARIKATHDFLSSSRLLKKCYFPFYIYTLENPYCNSPCIWPTYKKRKNTKNAKAERMYYFYEVSTSCTNKENLTELIDLKHSYGNNKYLGKRNNT